MNYQRRERERAARWKATTPCLPAGARLPAPYGVPVGESGTLHDFCLPRPHAVHNLLPDVRQQALALFADLGVEWEGSVGGGPSNHLLSSQVQCVNALLPMVGDPERICGAFGDVLDIAEVMEIEPTRHLTFAYVGPDDVLGEAPRRAQRPRRRGGYCTSADAAFRFRTSAGQTEVALVEWIYTDAYPRPRRRTPSMDVVHAARYQRHYEDPRGPLLPLVPFELMLDQPFFRLLRLQLLAWRLEQATEFGFHRVRVLRVLPPENQAYQASIVRPEMRELGATVDGIWSQLLRDRSRFVHVDPAVFLDPRITSDDYVARYGGDPTP